jgi:hypothetical protein
MTQNLHYGKLDKEVADRLLSKMPGTLVAGRYRTTEIATATLSIMRIHSHDATERNTVSHCFVCSGKEITCAEHAVVECLCGRKFFKYYDITNYQDFTEQSRWNLFWNRLSFKMSSILKARK